MIFLSWNCRGARRNLTVDHLYNLARSKRPSIIFLMETMQDSFYLERKRSFLNYAHSFYVDPSNHSGGLALWWVNDIRIQIISFSKHCIHVKVENNHEFFVALSMPLVTREIDYPFGTRLVTSKTLVMSLGSC
ncbi:hypothetical protein LINGRAHAP2_LOCUS34996 [Linum grandiflorum]